MRYLAATVVGAVMSAGAAQATVYQYDVTMELTSLSLGNVFAVNSEPIDPRIEDLDCYTSGGDYVCEGDIDLTDVRYGLEQIDLIASEITGSFRLDSELDAAELNTSNIPARCSGSTALCSVFQSDIGGGTYSVYSASADDFQIDFFSTARIYTFGSDGLSYGDDNSRSFTYGNTEYTSPGGPLSLEYTMTSLDIAPIPLPASLPLMGIGMAAMGFAAHRRKASRAA